MTMVGLLLNKGTSEKIVYILERMVKYIFRMRKCESCARDTYLELIE